MKKAEKKEWLVYWRLKEKFDLRKTKKYPEGRLFPIERCGGLMTKDQAKKSFDDLVAQGYQAKWGNVWNDFLPMFVVEESTYRQWDYKEGKYLD